MDRKELKEVYGEVLDTQELQEKFEVVGFLAPFVEVVEKESGNRGTMEFQTCPRFYFDFRPKD